MKLSQMEGTPWHIETLKMSENDDKRRKQWCKYYQGNHCSKLNIKCYGSKNCDYYVYDENKKGKKTEKKDNGIQTENYYDKKYLIGSFLLQYEDGTKEMFKIGKNIKNDAPIIEYVRKCNSKNSFIFNGERIIVLDKNLRYSYEARKIHNPYLRLILSSKNLDELCVNNTEYIYFSFRIKLLKENKNYGFYAGKNIRWDDPLLHKIFNLKQGTIFEYKNKKIQLLKIKAYKKQI